MRVWGFFWFIEGWGRDRRRGNLFCNMKVFARDKISRNVERNWKKVIRSLV